MIFNLDEIPDWSLWSDVRSVLSSADGALLAGYGELYTDATAATTITDTTSYFDLAGTWTLGEARNFDESSANGRLTYTGSLQIEAVLICSASVTVAGNNDIIHLRLEKNGNAVTSSDATQKLSVGDDVASMMCVGITPLSTGDYVTAATRNETATDNVTAQNAHLIAIGLAL